MMYGSFVHLYSHYTILWVILKQAWPISADSLSIVWDLTKILISLKSYVLSEDHVNILWNSSNQSSPICKQMSPFDLLQQGHMRETWKSNRFCWRVAWITLELLVDGHLSLGIPEMLNFCYNHKKDELTPQPQIYLRDL